MISALELKNKLEKYYRDTPLLDYNVQVGFLPAIILFPFFLALTTQKEFLSIVHSPFLFGFGFAGFFVSSLVVATAFLVSSPRALDGYIRSKDAYGRFNVNSILKDGKITRQIAEGILDYIKLHRKHDPLYQSDLEAIKTQFDTKLENTKTEFRKEIENIRLEYENKLEFIVRELRITRLARHKERQLRLQGERDNVSKTKENIILREKLEQITKKFLDALEELRRFKGE